MGPSPTTLPSKFTLFLTVVRFIGPVLIWASPGSLSAAETQVSVKPRAEGGLVYEGEPIVLELRKPGEPRQDAIRHPDAPSAVLTVFDVDNTTVTATLILAREDRGADRATADNEDLDIVRLGPLPVGYYSIAEPQSGVFTKVAVIRRPPETPATQSPFGVDAFLAWRTSDPALRRAAARTLRRAGIHWVRDRLSWSETQPASTTLAWGRYDESLAAQKESGLHVLEVFHDIPAWASPLASGDPEIRNHQAPRDPLLASRYFESAARHWGSSIDAWELWNEFDIPVFFQGTPDEYASVLRSAALGVRHGAPDTVILSGSTTLSVFASLNWGGRSFSQINAPRFVDRLLHSSVGDCFDIWNMHYYGPSEGLLDRIRHNRALLGEYGLQDKAMWITEMGQTATEKMGPLVDDLERRQAEYLAKVYTLALSENVERIFYFAFPDFLEHGVSAWGIVEATRDQDLWLPKPAFAAYANLVRALSGRACLGRYPSKNPLLEAFVFGPANGTSPDDSFSSNSVIVAWVKDGSGDSAPIPAPPGSWPSDTVVLDLFGRSVVWEGSSDSVLRAGASPLFVFVNRRLPARRSPAFRTKSTADSGERRVHPRPYWCEIRTSETLLDFADSSIDGIVRVVNAEPREQRMRMVLDAVSGTPTDLATSPGAGLLLTVGEKTIPPQGVREERFHLNFTSELRPSPGTPLALRGSLVPADVPSAEATRTVRFFDVQPPFRFESPGLIPAKLLVSDSSDRSWTVNLVSQSRARSRSTASVQLYPPTSGTFPEELEALRMRREEYVLPDPGGVVAIPVCTYSDLWTAVRALGEAPRFLVTTRLGNFAREINVQPEVAAIPHESERASLPPWRLAASESTTVAGLDTLGRESTPMGADLHPYWTRTHLVIDVVVDDTEISNPSRTGEPWRGDALEIFLDLRESARLGTPGYKEQVYQVFVVPPDFSHAKATLDVWQPKGKAVPRSRARLEPSPDGRTWGGRIELAWKDLGVESAPGGREIGIEFALDDHDPSDSSRRQVIWHGSASNWRDPTVFSRVQILPPGAAAASPADN